MARVAFGVFVLGAALNGCASSSDTLDATPPPEPRVAVMAGPAASEQPIGCEPSPVLPASHTARLSVSVLAKFGGATATLGTALYDGNGHGYMLSFLAFYLSDFQLVDSAAKLHPATVLAVDGKPRSYGLQLVNLDEQSSLSLALAAPPGRYQALRFSVGVSEACNALDAPTRGWPLSIESEMNWGWTMLHARIEGFRLDPIQQGFMYHLGLPEEFRSLTVLSELELQSAASRTLELDLAQLFVAAEGAVGPASQSDVADGFARAGTFTLE